MNITARLLEGLKPLRLWTEQPISGLGDYAFGVRLLALACAGVCLLWIASALLRASCRGLLSLSASLYEFWSAAFPPEIPGADSDDQSEELEKRIESAAQTVIAASSETSGKAIDLLMEATRSLSQNISEECDRSAQRVREIFSNGDGARCVECLGEEARTIGHLLLEEASKHRLLAARTLPGQSALNDLRDEFRKLSNRASPEFRIRQIKEELGIEHEDSLFVAAFKLQRRAVLFLTGLTGKARAQERIRRVPFQAILTQALLTDFFEDIRRDAEEFDNRYCALAQMISDAAKIARFNLHAAEALLDGEEDAPPETREEARVLAVEGLDRTKARIEKLAEEAELFSTPFSRSIQTASQEAAKQIRRDCDVADTFGERVSKAVESLLSSWRILEERGQRKLRSTRSWTDRLRLRSQNALHLIREQLGLVSPAIELSQATLEQSTVEFALHDTPPLYRRLFRFEPLTDEDFMIGREDAMSTVSSVRKRLDAGRSAALSVSGLIGTGKTSFVRCALQRHFADKEVFHLTIERHLSTETDLVAFLSSAISWPAGASSRDLPSLISALNGLPERPVIVLEGASMLHLRKIGGFDAIRALISLLAGTEGKVCWIFLFSRPGWDYLNSTFDIARRFDANISLEGLNRDQLEAALMARHEVSGYDLEFVDGPGLSPDVRWKLKNAKTAEKRRGILRMEFFDTLHRAAGSNIYAALYYWLRASQNLGRRKVRISPVSPFRKETLGELTLAELFAMAYALEHDHLTPELHSQMLRSTLTESRTLLDYLAHRRILTAHGETDGPPRYAPNPILMRPILDALRDRNFIRV